VKLRKAITRGSLMVACLGLVAGIVLGLIMLGVQLEVPQGYYPEVKLKYMYIRFNEVNAPILSKYVMVSLTVVIEVGNPYDKGFVIKNIHVSIPEQLSLETIQENASTATITATIRVPHHAIPANKITIIKSSSKQELTVIYDSSKNRSIPAIMQINDLLLGCGETMLTFPNGYVPARFSKYIVLMYTAFAPENFVDSFREKVNEGIYIVISFNGHLYQSKGYVEGLFVYKVKPVVVNMNEFYYNAFPENMGFHISGGEVTIEKYG